MHTLLEKGDLQEGLWAVLFGHPLPLDAHRCGKSMGGAPQDGALAIRVDVSVHTCLFLNDTRTNCGRRRSIVTKVS